MSEFTVTSGFSKLNQVLGNTKPAIPYSWNGSEVLLRSGKFDQRKYLDGKIFVLKQRDTVLSIEQRKEVFDRVVSENKNLLFDMHGAQFEQQQQYDQKFNLLLEAAFTRAENEHNLKISKENIKNTLPVSDSWMDVSQVNKLMRLVSTNPGEAPNPHKFIPKHRR